MEKQDNEAIFSLLGVLHRADSKYLRPPADLIVTGGESRFSELSNEELRTLFILEG